MKYREQLFLMEEYKKTECPREETEPIIRAWSFPRVMKDILKLLSNPNCSKQKLSFEKWGET